MIAHFKKYKLQFKTPAKTSRGEYKTRQVWFLMLQENGETGIGECAPLPGLSSETPKQVEKLLNEIYISPGIFIRHPDLTSKVSSVRFALETAWQDLQNGGNQQLFPSAFSKGEKGIPINGLVWMGDENYMKKQILEKIAAGFRCIKLKIGGIDFEKEIKILKAIRKEYDANQITLRLDANGAFNPVNAMEKLNRLAPLQIHSIEQPISNGLWREMANICSESPIPIALDEELIGIYSKSEKEKLLEKIRPKYIVLKPSLHGGFSGCNEWIELAETLGIGWWATSYLESNFGLNAIAQWAFYKNAKGFQGLGTGALFTNNLASPLEIRGGELWTNTEKVFQFSTNLFKQ